MVDIDPEVLKYVFENVLKYPEHQAAAMALYRLKKEFPNGKYEAEMLLAELRSILMQTRGYLLYDRIKELMTKAAQLNLLSHLRPYFVEDIYHLFSNNNIYGDCKAFALAKEGFMVISHSDIRILFSPEESAWYNVKLALCLLLVKYDALSVILIHLRASLDKMDEQMRKQIDYTFVHNWTKQFYWMHSTICDDATQRVTLLDVILLAVANDERSMSTEVLNKNMILFAVSCEQSGDKCVSKMFDPELNSVTVNKCSVLAKILFKEPCRTAVGARRMAFGLLYLKKRIMEKFDSDTMVSGFLLPVMFGESSKIQYGNRARTAGIMTAAATSLGLSDYSLLKEAVNLTGYDDAIVTMLLCFQFSGLPVSVINYGEEYLRHNPDFKERNLDKYLAVNFMIACSYLTHPNCRDPRKAVEYGLTVLKFVEPSSFKETHCNSDWRVIMPENIGCATLQIVYVAIAKLSITQDSGFLGGITLICGEPFIRGSIYDRAQECLEWMKDTKKNYDFHCLLPFIRYGSVVHKFSYFFDGKDEDLAKLRNQYQPNHSSRVAYEIAKLVLDVYGDEVKMAIVNKEELSKSLEPYDGPKLTVLESLLDEHQHVNDGNNALLVVESSDLDSDGGYDLEADMILQEIDPDAAVLHQVHSCDSSQSFQQGQSIKREYDPEGPDVKRLKEDVCDE